MEHLHFTTRIPQKRSAIAFSLLEITIVLAIIGVVVGGGMVVLMAATQSAQVNATVARMEKIEEALFKYAVAFNRIPCPSSLVLTSTNANYGVEAATQGTCTGGTPAANFAGTSGTVEGGVPTRALQLPDDYMYDAWGRRIRYAVDPSFTVTDALPVGTGTCVSTKSITVNDSTGAARTTNGLYALISSGKNGHGAYNNNGVIFNAASTNTSEQTNCHCNASAVATTYSPTYVQKLPTLDSTSALNSYDDIVKFKDAWQIQALNFPLSGVCTKYAYVADQTNNRVQKFNATTGTYISQIGGCASGACSATSGNGEFNGPWGVAIDSSGNIWVADYYNYRIQKFDSSGAYVLQVGTFGTGNYNFKEPYNIAVDSSDNVWVVDITLNNVKKFNSSGVYQSQLGCGGAGNCSQSTADGRFGGPHGVAIDPSGNIWVSDTGNDRIQKFDSSGTFLLKSGTDGTGDGQFSEPLQIASDSSGNIWVVDYFNFRWQKLNSAGTYVSKFGTGGNGNGEMNGDASITVDSSGYIWTGGGNNRVQKLDTSGVWQSQLGSCASSACSASTANGGFTWAGGVAFTSR